jgi:hypothetical protein
MRVGASRIPYIWCVVVTLTLGTAYQTVRWSFVDTAVNVSAAGDTRSWHEFFSDVLTKSVEYRPLLDVGTRVAYRIIGLNLGAYKIIVILEFALILLALAALFHATGWPRVVASTIALSVAVGLHTSQILFLFVPLNAYAGSLLLVLTVALLALTPRARRFEWVILPLTLVALLWLEIGVFIVPLVAVAWVMKAPGTTWRSAAAAGGGLAIYLIARLGFSPGGVPLDSPETGLGFSTISADDSYALFANARWLFWLYNVGATLLTVLASEPRAGRFQFVEALIRGHVPLWMWLHVMSSLVTTMLVAVALLGIRRRPHRDHLIAAFGVVLVIGGSVLGFLYTRDRIGLPVGFGYAMLVYVALSALLERRTPKRQTVAIGVLVAALGVCWQIRTGERYVALRDTAWEYHLEWARDGVAEEAGRNPILAHLRESALRRIPADARRDPAWTYKLFERRHEPVAQAEQQR